VVLPTEIVFSVQLESNPCGDFWLSLSKGNDTFQPQMCFEGEARTWNMTLLDKASLTVNFRREARFNLSCFAWCSQDELAPNAYQPHENETAHAEDVEAFVSTFAANLKRLHASNGEERALSARRLYSLKDASFDRCVNESSSFLAANVSVCLGETKLTLESPENCILRLVCTRLPLGCSYGGWAFETNARPMEKV